MPHSATRGARREHQEVEHHPIEVDGAPILWRKRARNTTMIMEASTDHASWRASQPDIEIAREAYGLSDSSEFR